MINKYKDLLPDELEKHLSNYLINSWSYSKTMSFARNEKNFEKTYIYNCFDKSPASAMAGKAYHEVLKLYFINKKDGKKTDIIDLEKEAFNYIDERNAYEWKLQKTTSTIIDCKESSIKIVSQLIRNFLSEIEIYESVIKDILGVEQKISAWITVNGVEIPLPCHLVIDLIIKTNNNKIIVIDHKSKRTFTDEKELGFVLGKQAITYTLGYEEETRQKVDEFWIVENKYSKNKDNSKQLNATIVKMDKNNRKLYESMLYEPLRKMVEAVSDPDYVYMINDNDSFSDRAEVYGFWAKTMIAEVEDFNIPKNKKPLIEKRLKKIRDASLISVTPTVIKNFKTFTEQFIPYDLTNKDMTNQQKIEHVLRSFGIITKVQHIFEGYSSSSYLLEISAGTQISSINKYRLDIANALNLSNVRVQKDLFVYDGKSYLVIESGIKNNNTLFWDKSKLNGDNKIPLGLDNFKQLIYWDLNNHSTPHMLVCGATGSGKTVFTISTLEYCLLAGIKEIHIFDPKRKDFNTYKNHNNIKVYNDIEDIELGMMMLVEEMERRTINGNEDKILIIIDEFADAFANARGGNELKNYGEEIIGQYKNGMPKTKRVITSLDKSLEQNLRLLLQKGRALGFRIIGSTQRASAKIITGDAKVNFPVQVCFRVPKDIDSIVVLDESGAEALNGKGDGLIKSPEYINTMRFQAFYHK